MHHSYNKCSDTKFESWLINDFHTMQFGSIYAKEPNAVFYNCLLFDVLPKSQQFPMFGISKENPGSTVN